MVILEVRRVCLNIHRYDWWANLCLHKRMAKNSITYLFNPERYQLKMQILQFGIYKTTYNGNTGLIFDNLQCKNLYTA